MGLSCRPYRIPARVGVASGEYNDQYATAIFHRDFVDYSGIARLLLLK